MKKAIIIVWCFVCVVLVAACKNGDPSLLPSGTAETSTVPNGTGSDLASGEEDSYKSIVCETVSDFRNVNFLAANSRTQIQIMFPKHWTLEESDKGYSILQASKVIGSVTVFDSVESEDMENVHSEKMMMSGVTITNRIDRIDSEGEAMYIRTLSYRYNEVEGTGRTLTVTMPYQQIDDDAVRAMMRKVKIYTANDPKMGVLPLADNRKGVLILGNSFVTSSKVGSILQKMCGTSLSVEAQSRAYARVTTYVQDEGVMNRIRSGDYAAVILCGLYDSESLVNLEHMVNICASSNTKLAIFPAHNENLSMIRPASSMYPSAVLLDWKGEIDSLISSGIDQTHFCVADSHKHSTPLAGYVGAHMIYRAIFGKVPAETLYSEVSQPALALLGEYPTTGIVSFSEPDATYPMNAG